MEKAETTHINDVEAVAEIMLLNQLCTQYFVMPLVAMKLAGEILPSVEYCKTLLKGVYAREKLQRTLNFHVILIHPYTVYGQTSLSDQHQRH